MVKCHNCGRFGHYSNHCPNPVKQVTCYKCKQIGHYSDKCPVASVVQQQQQQQREAEIKVPNVDVSTTKLSLQVDGWWGKNSALVSDSCGIATLKLAFCNRMVELGYIDRDKDLDVRNRTCHIDLNSNQELFTKLKAGIEIDVSMVSFEIARDFVALHVGFGRHVTLLYKKSLTDTIGKDVINDIIVSLLRNNPHSKKQATVEEDNAVLCVVCMDGPKNVAIETCGHVSVCHECIVRLDKCPACRGEIASWKRVFVV